MVGVQDKKQNVKDPSKPKGKNDKPKDWEGYESKEEIQWMLDLPDTNIGSTEIAEGDDTDYFVFRDEQITRGKNIKFIPGLYKLFDECAVNAADNGIRTMGYSGSKKCTEIKFDIHKDHFAVENNGKSIPIEIHEKENLWVPEMIFGKLRTGGNYKKGEKRIVGGKNGLGAKLAVIFSTKTTITIQNKKQKKQYVQVFTNNMRTKTVPVITDMAEGKNLVRIECYPEFPRFDNSTEFSQDMMDYLKRRVYDLSASSPKHIAIHLNNEKIKIADFKSYVKLYEPNINDTDIIYAKPHERWEIAVVNTEKKFRQVSFVNNIHTYKGGKHVNYVMSKIEDHLFTIIKKKQPTAKKAFIKNYVHIYINCFIENPSFDSQTKGQMTSNKKNFGSEFKFDKEFLKSLETCGIVEQVIQFEEFRVNKGAKKTDGKKQAQLSNIPKLHDALYAGKRHKSKDCILILTEGDSAAATAIAGLSEKQREIYGVYPLKGKIFNVRGEKTTKILSNKEINEFKRIMGLKQGQIVTDASELRYGRVCLMTDQDLDGYHIKGLAFNLIDCLWHSCFKIKHFICSMRTPILKATCGKKNVAFYTEQSYDKWYKKLPDTDKSKWKIKYYKGLGTSTSLEAREYFDNIEKNMVYYEINETTKDHLDMVFNKDRPDDRKQWLGTRDKDTEVVYNKDNEALINEFIDNELIHFSNQDNIRSIPSVIDGLKNSQRKILYGAFKKNIASEVKVAQLGGYISEHTGYHHGEVSLYQTIVKMAQWFVGSNNINYFKPGGQFGTRMAGGNDFASPRYIFTEVNPLVDTIHRKEDFPVLDYPMVDNAVNEPAHYCPIIPMILVNGAKGVGTGYSTDISSYNPLEIVENIRHKMKKQPYTEMLPYFFGFTGKIKTIASKGESPCYVTSGKYRMTDEEIYITEIPIGTWSIAYKAHIDTLVIEKNPAKAKDKKEEAQRKKQFVKSYDSILTEHGVKITLYTDFHKVNKHIMNGKLSDILKLDSKISTSNMVLFTEKNSLHKFNQVNEIMDVYYDVRYTTYEKRVKYQIDDIEKKLIVLNERIRFVIGIIENTFVIFKKTKKEVREILETHEFKKIEKTAGDDGYEYLLGMKIHAFTREKIDKMAGEIDVITEKLDYLKKVTVHELWNKELDEFIVEYTKYTKMKQKEIDDSINRGDKDAKKDKKKKKK
jgi:DNA topoisomerase-2